jgi:CubicO group peptidase (beta-lactamase class C family)
MPRSLSLVGAASLVALVTAASSAAPAKPATRSPLAGLDTFLAATMKDWKMPATAVAIVKEGQVVLLAGDQPYDLRDGAHHHDLRGHKLVQHGGNIDGFSLLLSFLPQDDMGVAVLTNLNGTPYPSIVTYQVYDRLLGLPPVDWSARFLERDQKARAAEADAKAKGYTPRKAGTHPSHDLADYVGDCEHPGYRLVKIGRSGDDLTLTYHKANSTLKHFHYDVLARRKQ